jgi:hypothetical protein
MLDGRQSAVDVLRPNDQVVVWAVKTPDAWTICEAHARSGPIDRPVWVAENMAALAPDIY